jgi:glycerol-3-phosphate acyltransferase PlsY
MLELGVKFTLAFMLGSVSGSLLLGLLKGVDIRTVGSGNAGGTNALRTQGKWFAFWVMVIDVGKGALAVAWLPHAVLPWLPHDPVLGRDFLTYAMAMAAVLGHCYPLWFSFRGGKGAATAVGALCIITPELVLPLMGVWLLIIALSGYVGLATMGAAVSVAAYVGATRLPAQHGLFVFSCLLAATIIYTHRSNIMRMRAGTEVRHGLLFGLRRGA